MASNAVRTGMLALAVLCALPAGRSPLAAVDAARARYGDADAAREDKEPSAVLALLQGMSLAEAAEAMDDAAFARAEAEGTAAAYAGYRSSYPEGRHVEEAERRERERTPGRQFRDCPECPEMVVAPEGSFLMGSTSGDDDERPVHEVTIARPFAVGVYEVTFAEWDACVSDGGCGGYRPSDTSWGRGVRPVINVSWEDAQGYVRWLSRKTGEAYRLLSESEWEYVARAGTTGPYHFGSSLSSSQANYGGDRRSTVPVGSYPANAFGLHDVHGNVWEWVEDCWNDSYNGAPSNGSAWTSGDCSRRVLRGGSWFSGPGALVSTTRIGSTTGDRIHYYGFRVARTLTP